MHGTYEFRKELLETHRPNIRNHSYAPTENQACVDDSWHIEIASDCGIVIQIAAEDLQDYLRTSLGICVALKPVKSVKKAEKTIVVATAGQLEYGWDHQQIGASYDISVTENSVVVCGFDDRGCAQGCYQLEDRFNQIHAPYLSLGDIYYAPQFSPRMIHSGYELDRYPDAHLSAIAHTGMDAILLFVNGVNSTPTGYTDFNDLIRRAGKYGLDVYAYSYYKSHYHPDDPAAEAEMEANYGQLFRQCPGFKGVVLVGESVEFPSQDTRVSKLTYDANLIDGIPTGKPTAGWFPCNDYHLWVSKLRDVVRKYRPDADIVFWTYNWGYAPEAERLALIDSLPTDISLMATFEMFEERLVDGVRTRSCDYTASFAQAGKYFKSEAKRAKERGIRLYTQANSAGLTWDFGTVPYEPVPMQWAKRYEAMLEAKEEYGLCGVMESHHFGFWPSFISKLEKKMFTAPCPKADTALQELAQELYGEYAEKALSAWQDLSHGMHYYICTNEDQYGPFRVGPSYPLVYHVDVQIPTVPYAHFGGNKICIVDYGDGKVFSNITYGHNYTAPMQMRHGKEADCLEKMEALFYKGRNTLEEVAEKLDGVQRADCLRLCNLVHYMEHCIRTTIHTKRWSLLRGKADCCKNLDELLEIHRQMTAIGEAEIENARQTIPLVQADSRLGWEPSMEYIGSEYHLNWKIRQVRYVLDYEIPRYDWDIRYIQQCDGSY